MNRAGEEAGVWIREWAARRPVPFAVAVTAGWVAMTLALAELPPHPFWGPVYVNGIGFAAGLAFAALLGWRRAVGLDHLHGGLWVVPLALLAATEAWPGVRGSVDEAVILLCVGLNEELWSRGVILAGLRRLGPYACATCVGVLFGLQHLINLRWGQALGDTAVQVIEAGSFGFVLAALRIRGVALWWLILFHAATDYVSIESPGAPPAWQQLAEILLKIAYGVALLRLPAGALQRHDPATGAA